MWLENVILNQFKELAAIFVDLFRKHSYIISVFWSVRNANQSFCIALQGWRTNWTWKWNAANTRTRNGRSQHSKNATLWNLFMSRAIDLARETWLNSETDDYLCLRQLQNWHLTSPRGCVDQFDRSAFEYFVKGFQQLFTLDHIPDPRRRLVSISWTNHSKWQRPSK